MEVTYKESGYGKYTLFRLFIDEIEIKTGEFLGPSSTVRYPLNELRPKPSALLKRNFELNMFQFAVTILGVSGIFYLWATYFEEAWFLYTALMLYGCLISGLVLLRARIEYTVFLFLDHTPLFAIGKRGKQKEEYESFVETLIERITYANQASEAIGTSSAGPDSSS